MIDFFYNCWFDLGRRMKIFYVDGVIEAKTSRRGQKIWKGQELEWCGVPQHGKQRGGLGPVMFGQQPPRMVALRLLGLVLPFDAAAQNWVRTWAQLRWSQHADQGKEEQGPREGKPGTWRSGTNQACGNSHLRTDHCLALTVLFKRKRGRNALLPPFLLGPTALRRRRSRMWRRRAGAG